MTRKLELGEEAVEELRQTFQMATERALRDRCQAILMVWRGKRPRKEIAEDLEISPRTLRRWVEAYAEGGLEGLKIEWYKGPDFKIPDAYAPEVLEWVKKGPVACGLDRANWTYEELAHHFYRAHGIRVCLETMRSFCQRHGVRPYRPTYRYLRGDPDKQAAARVEIEDLKKSPGRRARAAQPG